MLDRADDDAVAVGAEVLALSSGDGTAAAVDSSGVDDKPACSIFIFGVLGCEDDVPTLPGGGSDAKHFWDIDDDGASARFFIRGVLGC